MTQDPYGGPLDPVTAAPPPRRRSSATTLVAVLAVVALAVAVIALVVVLGRDDGDPAAQPSASPSSAPPSPAPSSASPEPSSPPSPAASPSASPSPSAPVPTTVPEDFALADLLGPADGVETTIGPVEGLENVGICDETLPGIDTATDTRFERREGPEFGETLGVLVFADADAAVAFMTGVEQEAAACPPVDPPVPGRVAAIAPLEGVWAQGYSLLLVDVPQPSTEEGILNPNLGTDLLLSRVGSSVGLLLVGSENFVEPPFAVDPEAVAGLRPPLDALAERQCLWTVEGC